MLGECENIISLVQAHIQALTSHWVPLSYGLVPHLSKKLSKFLFKPFLLSRVKYITWHLWCPKTENAENIKQFLWSKYIGFDSRVAIKLDWPCVLSCPSGGVGKYDEIRLDSISDIIK